MNYTDVVDFIKNGGTMTGLQEKMDEEYREEYKERLNDLEKKYSDRKLINQYYRQHGELEGCPNLTKDGIAEIQSEMRLKQSDIPYSSWEMQSMRNDIRSMKSQIQRWEKKYNQKQAEAEM